VFLVVGDEKHRLLHRVVGYLLDDEPVGVRGVVGDVVLLAGPDGPEDVDALAGPDEVLPVFPVVVFPAGVRWELEPVAVLDEPLDRLWSLRGTVDVDRRPVIGVQVVVRLFVWPHQHRARLVLDKERTEEGPLVSGLPGTVVVARIVLLDLVLGDETVLVGERSGHRPLGGRDSGTRDLRGTDRQRLCLLCRGVPYQGPLSPPPEPQADEIAPTEKDHDGTAGGKVPAARPAVVLQVRLLGVVRVVLYGHLLAGRVLADHIRCCRATPVPAGELPRVDVRRLVLLPVDRVLVHDDGAVLPLVVVRPLVDVRALYCCCVCFVVLDRRVVVDDGHPGEQHEDGDKQ